MRWMWIDAIVTYEPGPGSGARLVAIKNISLAEEHLHDHLPAGPGHDAVPVMPASLMIEGMAQTAGILVGATRRFREKVILAKITKARLDRDAFPGDTLRYDARLDRIDDAGAATTGLVEIRSPLGDDPDVWHPLGAIDLMFSHVDQNLAGLDFPEENFVFGENLRVILDTAGIALGGEE